MLYHCCFAVDAGGVRAQLPLHGGLPVLHVPKPCPQGLGWGWPLLLGRGDKAPYGRSVKSLWVLDVEAVASNCC